MKIDIGFISAETHTPDYLMHKYWARKPHNVIKECILKLTNENDVVLDPFCGSGVTLREASKINRKAVGFDVNPSAYLITKVLNNPPCKKEFIDTVENIFNTIQQKYRHLFLTESGKEIKYLSHRIITKCKCGKNISFEKCDKIGKKTLCPFCGSTLHFNLETMASTEIFNITIDGDKEYVANKNELERQTVLSNYSDMDIHEFEYQFPTNRRILAFEGIKTSMFFTKRNFTIISAFAHEFHLIKNEKVKNAALLLLTGSAAQCSRLIAHRNNMATGGPAWSVPGFWIPLEHLETNPFVHIRARIKKFIRAIEYIELNPGKSETTIVLGDSFKILQSEEYKNIKAKLIFLDPPYGDSVPYTEFSNIWNSFLKQIPNSDDDISVTDRIEKNESWRIYEEKLISFMKVFSEHLDSDGKLLITFNNNDLRAWSSLIKSLQTNHFVAKKVFYQIPAVISSKAQMAISSSYISDVYSVYEYDKNSVSSKDLSMVTQHLILVANARDGHISKQIVDREFIISWLENNVDCSLLPKKDIILNSVFVKKDDTYILKEQYFQNVLSLRKVIEDFIKKELSNGPITLFDCYKKVAITSNGYGLIEFSEFKNYLDRFIVSDGVILSSLF